jgi:hypothetical protein
LQLIYTSMPRRTLLVSTSSESTSRLGLLEISIIDGLHYTFINGACNGRKMGSWGR